MQATASGDMAASTPLELLTTFQTVQEERSRLYSQLSSGFKQYVSKPQEERDEIGYRVLMEHVTRGFADCSKKVLAVESSLAAAPVSRPDLAALLRKVQEGEREKLQVTVSLQALKTAVAMRADRRRMQQQDAHAAHAGSAPGAAQGPMEHACCGHAHGHGHPCGEEEEAVEEASEEECDSAVKEILQRLDRCVGSINDALEEVRYEVEELKQDQ